VTNKGILLCVVLTTQVAATAAADCVQDRECSAALRALTVRLRGLSDKYNRYRALLSEGKRCHTASGAQTLKDVVASSLTWRCCL
jgi:hypothetical protein